MEFLKGKKTYLLAAGAITAIGLYVAGVIDADIANTILGICGFGSVITLRSAIANNQ